MARDLTIEPIKKQRIPEQIAERIRQMIVEGTLRPGEPLPAERDLAQRFGVSRGSVRDAVRMLELIGLLDTRHGEGTFVQELSVDNLVTPLATVLAANQRLQEELLDVRRMFEPAVARQAAARVTDEELAEMQHILDAQQAKVEAGQTAIAEDSAFHCAIARATHNQVVARIMETVNDLLIESRKITLRQEGRPLRSLEGHRAVVAALRRRDPEAAFRAMHAHVDQIAGLLRQTLQASRDGGGRGLEARATGAEPGGTATDG